MEEDAEEDAPAWNQPGFLSSVLSPSMNLRRLKLLIFPRYSGGGAPVELLKLRPTAYLDGLRGFAAFVVYWHHHELWAHQQNHQTEILENAFGYKDKYHLAAFPGLRIFFTGGHLAVAFFYIISGYVLSAKGLSLIHAGEHARAQLGDSLASSFFRRWIRLFLPLIVTTWVSVTLWHVFGRAWNSASPPKDTYGEELWSWYTQFKNFSFIFDTGQGWPSYNQHLWSIPLEMRGSIIVFTALSAFSRITTKARLWCEFALIVYFLYIADGFYGALFMSGMLQCDLDMLARDPDSDFPDFLRRLETHKKPIYAGLIVIGLYFSGVPSQARDLESLRANPGWYWLSYLKPQAVFDAKWFYLFVGANIIMASIPRFPAFRRFFETDICQYLGHISFSLYLVHGPILFTIGDRLYHAVGYVSPYPENKTMLAAWIDIFPLPKSGPLGLEIAFLVPHLILFPLTFWLAHVVTRVVDDPSLRFAGWLYKKALTYGAPPVSRTDEAMRLA